MGGSPEEPGACAPTARILVVDDDAGYREAMIKTLARAGFETAGAADGLEAIRHLEVAAWDLVLTDLLMPRLGGLPLLREIRRAHPGIPVVIVTAYGEWRSYAEGMELGAVEYLNKPGKRDVLVTAIRRALGTNA
jgi:two-component system response regulator FlrC